MKLKKQVDRLSAPKPEYIPKDPYKYSDFRGLFSADFKDALTNAFDQELLDNINKDDLEQLKNCPSTQTQALVEKIK